MSRRRSTPVIQMDDSTRVAREPMVPPPENPSWSSPTCTCHAVTRTRLHLCPYSESHVGEASYHIRKWAKRFCEQGVSGLREKPRPGRPPLFTPEVTLHVVKLARRMTRSDGKLPLPMGLPRTGSSRDPPMEWSPTFQPIPSDGSCVLIELGTVATPSLALR